MIRTVFIDAAFLVSLINPRDQNHQKAREALVGVQGAQLVTTDAVLTEVLNYYSERGDYLRREALTLIKAIMNREDVNFIYHGKYWFYLGLERFEDRQDKGYSLTDCMSMVIMESDGIQEVLTSDKHFTQAGFTILM
jgi:uncharacterized protein